MYCWDAESGRKYVRRSRLRGDHLTGYTGGAESREGRSASLGYFPGRRNKFRVGVTRVSLRVPRKSLGKRLRIQVDDKICVFFQAEDGIRYLTVTGVQTCALPI